MMTAREDMLLDEITRLRVLVKTLRAQNSQISEDYLTLAEMVSIHQCTPQATTTGANT